MKSAVVGNEKVVRLGGGAELEMLFCPAGSFVMGSPDDECGRDADECQHMVSFTDGFWIGKYPVTQRQWFVVMGEGSCRDEGDVMPVVNVSWNDVQLFMKYLNRRLIGGGFRLPTEAEWEYACRAGSTTSYSWGGALNGDRANCDGERPCGTVDVGRFLRQMTSVGMYGENPWGFCDMHGNVMEWCNDWYDEFYGLKQSDAKRAYNERRYKVLRGGSWASDARDCRSAYRDREEPNFRSNEIGFRLCCDNIPESDF